MPSATYNKSIITTNVWSATYGGSGSGTIYTVPTDTYIQVCSVSIANFTTFNLYLNGGKIVTASSVGSVALAGYFCPSGGTLSFDTTGGSGSTSITVHFIGFKTVSP